MIVNRTKITDIAVLTRQLEDGTIELGIARATENGFWPLSPTVDLTVADALALTETLARLIDAASAAPDGWLVEDTWTPGGSVH